MTKRKLKHPNCRFLTFFTFTLLLGTAFILSFYLLEVAIIASLWLVFWSPLKIVSLKLLPFFVIIFTITIDYVVYRVLRFLLRRTDLTKIILITSRQTAARFFLTTVLILSLIWLILMLIHL